MTVYELIQRLQEFPSELEVWHDGGGDPYCAGQVKRIEVVHLGSSLVNAPRPPDTFLELS